MRKICTGFLLVLMFISMFFNKPNTEIDESQISVADTAKWTEIERMRFQTNNYRIHYIGHNGKSKYIDANSGYTQFEQDESRAGEIEMLIYTKDGKDFFYGFKVYVDDGLVSLKSCISSNYF